MIVQEMIDQDSVELDVGIVGHWTWWRNHRGLYWELVLDIPVPYGVIVKGLSSKLRCVRVEHRQVEPNKAESLEGVIRTAKALVRRKFEFIE